MITFARIHQLFERVLRPDHRFASRLPGSKAKNCASAFTRNPVSRTGGKATRLGQHHAADAGCRMSGYGRPVRHPLRRSATTRTGGHVQYMLLIFDCDRPEPGDPRFPEAPSSDTRSPPRPAPVADEAS